MLGFGLVGFPLGGVNGTGASMSDGDGIEETVSGGSSMVRRESTHVGGLCSKMDKPRNHLFEVAMKKDSSHNRPIAISVKRTAWIGPKDLLTSRDKL